VSCVTLQYGIVHWMYPAVKTAACMQQVGCDFLADIHGDEEIEYNFLAGNEGIPAWDDRLKGLQDEFCQAFLHTSPDFQLGCGLLPSWPLVSYQIALS
jgi:hypothetical protein